MNTSVQEAWDKRKKLYAKGDNTNMNTSVQKAWDKRKKLYAKGDKLWAEGDILFYDAVIKAYGNAEIKWNRTDTICTLVPKEGEITLT